VAVEERPRAAKLADLCTPASRPAPGGALFGEHGEEPRNHYRRRPARIATGSAGLVLRRFLAVLAEQRAAGAGRLAGVQQVSEFAGQRPFLDGHVYIHPAEPGKSYELTVLGTSTAATAASRAALLQADFFAKLEPAARSAPAEPKLGAARRIHRSGRSRNNGGAAQPSCSLFSRAGHVFPLPRNHEYYVRIPRSDLRRSQTGRGDQHAGQSRPGEVFAEYMRRSRSCPTLLSSTTWMFVHAGSPRDADIAAKVTDFAALNEFRAAVPDAVVRSVDRRLHPADPRPRTRGFPFGKLQFETFMQRLGCSIMVRGHEKVDAGFRPSYGEQASLDHAVLGRGADNNDLPEESS